MVISGKSGRNTRSNLALLILRYHLVASLLKKPPGKRPAAANFSVIYRKGKSQ
jgi:hypothetical protein